MCIKREFLSAERRDYRGQREEKGEIWMPTNGFAEESRLKLLDMWHLPRWRLFLLPSFRFLRLSIPLQSLISADIPIQSGQKPSESRLFLFTLSGAQDDLPQKELRLRNCFISPSCRRAIRPFSLISQQLSRFSFARFFIAQKWY